MFASLSLRLLKCKSAQNAKCKAQSCMGNVSNADQDRRLKIVIPPGPIFGDLGEMGVVALFTPFSDFEIPFFFLAGKSDSVFSIPTFPNNGVLPILVFSDLAKYTRSPDQTSTFGTSDNRTLAVVFDHKPRFSLLEFSLSGDQCVDCSATESGFTGNPALT